MAEADLWDSILEFACLNVEHVVESISRVFKDNNDAFAAFMTRYFGLDAVDAKGSKKDEELGELVIALYQAALGYDRSMRQLHGLIFYASGMIQKVDFLHTRLKCLLQRTRFASEVYNLICTLGLPKRANDTFVKAAKSCQAFQTLTFHLIPSDIPQRRVRFADSTTLSSSRVDTIQSKSSRERHTLPSAAANSISISTFNTTTTTNTGPTAGRANGAAKEPQQVRPARDAEQPTSSNAELILAFIKAEEVAKVPRKLEVQGQAVDLTRITTKSEQATNYLRSVVLRGDLLAVGTNAYYSFGFSTTRNADEERDLGGLYRALLEDAPDSKTAFCRLAHALATNTIVSLLDSEGWGDLFRAQIPQLESFLRTPPAKRTSVWRLIQYIRIEDYTEPAAVLKRDYGFQFCRMHQECDVLKAIYTRILAKCTPKELHEACKHGRTAELAQQKGVHVDPGHRRFLKNDYGYPGVGFDNDESLQRHRAPLFKRTPKS